MLHALEKKKTTKAIERAVNYLFELSVLALINHTPLPKFPTLTTLLQRRIELLVNIFIFAIGCIQQPVLTQEIGIQRDV